MSVEAAAAASDVLERLGPIIHASAGAISDLRQLARRFGVSAYDASYLALALQLKLPLACSDDALKAALPRAGLKLA